MELSSDAKSPAKSVLETRSPALKHVGPVILDRIVPQIFSSSAVDQPGCNQSATIEDQKNNAILFPNYFFLFSNSTSWPFLPCSLGNRSSGKPRGDENQQKYRSTEAIKMVEVVTKVEMHVNDAYELKSGLSPYGWFNDVECEEDVHGQILQRYSSPGKCQKRICQKIIGPSASHIRPHVLDHKFSSK